MRFVNVSGAVVLLCLASGTTAGIGGCVPGTLERAEVPADGVLLRYALDPAARLEGHVMERGVTVSPEGDVHRLVEYDVSLAVAPDAASDHMSVDVSFSNVRLDLRLTRIRKHAANVIHVSDLPRIIEETETWLERSRIRLVFDDRGLVEAPKAPAELEEPARRLVETVLRTLAEPLVRLPEGRLRAGSTWEDGDDQEGRFSGLFLREGSTEAVARLRFDAEGEMTKADRDQPRGVEWTAETSVLFAVDAGYPVVVDSHRRVLDPIGGDGTFKLKAEFEATHIPGR